MDVIIVGIGLSGIFNAILLAESNYNVSIITKNDFFTTNSWYIQEYIYNGFNEFNIFQHFKPLSRFNNLCCNLLSTIKKTNVLENLYEILNSYENIKIYSEEFVYKINIDQNKFRNINTLCKSIDDTYEIKTRFATHLILCTGGVSTIFQNYDNHKTGDGLCLARDIGIDIIHMNEHLFKPLGLKHEGKTLNKNILKKGAYIVDQYSKQILQPASCELDNSTNINKIIQQQLRHENVVYLDTRHLADDELSQKQFSIKPYLLFTSGGIRISTSGFTKVNNIYACGECACTGYIYKKVTNCIMDDISLAYSILHNIQNKSETQYIKTEDETQIFTFDFFTISDEDIKSYTKNIQTIMYNSFSITKDFKDIKLRIKELNNISLKINSADILETNFKKIIKYYELKNMITNSLQIANIHLN